MKLQKRTLMTRMENRFVTIECGLKIESVVYCAALDQCIIIRGYTRLYDTGDQEIGNRLVTEIRRTDKTRPWNDLGYEGVG